MVTTLMLFNSHGVKDISLLEIMVFVFINKWENNLPPQSKPTNYITYLDATNLYSAAMIKPLVVFVG